jgi:hypothetical protein
MRKTLKQRIDESLLEIQQHQKRHDALLAQFKEKEEKARVHRFCKRGGYVEKYIPELKTLTEKQFYTYVEKVMQTPFANRILAELSADNETSVEPISANTAAQGNTPIKSKPADVTTQSDTSADQKPTAMPNSGSLNGNIDEDNLEEATC